VILALQCPENPKIALRGRFRSRLRRASADRRKRRAKRAPWRCATVVDVAVPLLDTVVLDEKELAMWR
jgi:hypothetical protein